MIMKRFEMLYTIRRRPEYVWDMIIVGGGATGVGVAVDASSRGYKTLLLEQHDFGAGTSSRSTKLVHGGVRYLQQGNITLVLESLKERGLMHQNAPHLVHDQLFIVPNYTWWEAPFYGIGLRLYDILAGKYGFGRSMNLSKEATVERIPTLETKGLIGGVSYHDGQFDDSRMVINLAETAAGQGGVLINYMKVTGLKKSGEFLGGVEVRDMESGDSYSLNAKVVINATGAFSDTIRKMDDEHSQPMIEPSQGVHIVLDKSFLPGETAIMVPHTDDGRVLFAIPWHECVIIGTTDTPISDVVLEPSPLDEELDFLFTHAERYLTKKPTRRDALSVFAGIRPLVRAGGVENTASLSRDHTINISRSGLVTIAGGKWTTYRKMAEDCVDQASFVAGLDEVPCVTKELNVHGYHRHADEFGDLAIYGSDALALQNLIDSDPRYQERLYPDRPVKAGEVIWAVRNEAAQTVEDFLARRTRCLLLGAKISIQMVPKVAQLMMEELGYDDVWRQQQIIAYTEFAQNYILD